MTDEEMLAETNQMLAGLCQRLDSRDQQLRALWEAEHGPFLPRGTYPGHKTPPCADCWSIVRHSDGPVTLEGVRKASTFIDYHDERRLVCEKHWRAGMREKGYTNAEILEILTDPVQGNLSQAEAEAMLAEDNAE